MEEYIKSSMDERVNMRFNLSDINSDVRFKGTGGRTVGALIEQDLKAVRDFMPDIVLLQIGSNDLADKKHPERRPETVGSLIEELVCQLHQSLNVCHVVVGEAMPRQKHYHQFPYFNQNIDILNRYLSVVLEPIPYVTFWRHKCVKDSKLKLYKRDQIHMNELGNFKLYKSFRGALIQALKALQL